MVWKSAKNTNLSITQPQIVRFRSTLVQSVIKWHPIYSKRSFSLLPLSSVNIAGSTVPISFIKTLGVTLNHHSLNQHVSSGCKSSYFHLCAFRHIHSVLTEDMAKSIAVALVSSRLDYANSVIFGTSVASLHKIQRVQNTLAKFVLSNTALSSTIALRQLHWLLLTTHSL